MGDTGVEPVPCACLRPEIRNAAICAQLGRGDGQSKSIAAGHGATGGGDIARAGSLPVCQPGAAHGRDASRGASPNHRVASPGQWVARPVPRTVYYFIPSAMTGFTVYVFLSPNRVFLEAFEVLEPDDGKLSCPVLRGPGGRKAA